MNKAIIFDLDGTLVDTLPDVTLALNKTLECYQLSPITQESVLNLMGHGAKFMLDHSFQNQNKTISPEEMQNALQKYLMFYKKNPIVNTSLYPYVIDTLSYLIKSNFKLGICTNKPSIIARIVIAQLQLDSYFSAIVCGDEIPNPKPDKQHIYDLLTFLNADISQTFMVGDSHIDELCALNSGIHFVGVNYGYGLNTFKPSVSINSLNELPSILNQRGLL